MQKLPLYYKALVFCASLDCDTKAMENLAAVMRKMPVINDFIHLALQEEMAGMLYKCLSRYGLPETLGFEQKNILRNWYLQTAKENLLHINALKRILSAFHENRIPVAMIKGMPLINEIYRDVGLRKMVDIDLWILETHVPAAEICLKKIGFRRDPVYFLKYQKAGVTIDLHTHFLGADRILSRKYLLDESPEDMFRNARIVYLNRAPVRCLQPCDQVLFLWLHAAKHNIGKLIWLVDIFNIIREWDDGQWIDLAARAEKLKQTASLERLLFFLEQLFGVRPHVDEKIFPRADCPSPIIRYLFRRRINDGALPFWAPLILFSPGVDFSKYLRYRIETLFPRPEILRQIFTGYRYRPNWPLYGLRSLQIACIALEKTAIAFFRKIGRSSG